MNSQNNSEEQSYPTETVTVPLRIPHAISELSHDIPAGWDNAKMLKTDLKEYSAEEIKELAFAIYKYMETKKPSHELENHNFFYELTLRFVWQEIVNERLGVHISCDEIERYIDEFEDTLSHLENEKLIRKEWINKFLMHIGKNYGIRSVLEKGDAKIDLDRHLERVIENCLKRHQQSKWIIYFEGIILGLISSGIFEYLRSVLESLVARAEGASTQVSETQINMIFGHLTVRGKQLQGDTKQLQQLPGLRIVSPTEYEVTLRASELMTRIVCGKMSEHDIDYEDLTIACIYVLQTLCLLGVLGSAVPHNPLMRETPQVTTASGATHEGF